MVLEKLILEIMATIVFIFVIIIFLWGIKGDWEDAKNIDEVARHGDIFGLRGYYDELLEDG